MAGIAIVLDLLRKNPGLCVPKSVHSHGLCSATAAASAAAVSITAGTPFASRALFGYGGISVAHCDAGTTWSEDYISTLGSKSLIEYERKEYYFELKPLFSALHWKSLAMTSLRSFLLFYLPLLEPRASLEDDNGDDFLQDTEEENRVDLVVPFKKSVKQIIRETTVLTTRRVLERLAVHYVSQRLAWKLLKDVRKSATRKADRGLSSIVYFFSVSRTTLRGHFLGVAASWIVQVGIDIYRYFSTVYSSTEETAMANNAEEAKVLRENVSVATIRCSSALIFASIGAGIGATLFRPSAGQWIGCAVGDLAGPIIVAKIFHLDL